MARVKAHPVRLSVDERQALMRVTRTGSHPVGLVRRARILLELDENDPDRDGPVPTQPVIAQRVGVTVGTVANLAKAYAAQEGQAWVVIQRKQPQAPAVSSVVTGDVEARLIAMACTQPPAGYSRWSLRLLEKHVALVQDIPDLDHSTIGRVLKKTNFALTSRIAGPSRPRPTANS